MASENKKSFKSASPQSNDFIIVSASICHKSHLKCADGSERLVGAPGSLPFSAADGSGIRHSFSESFSVLSPKYGGFFYRSCHVLLSVRLQRYNKISTCRD